MKKSIVSLAIALLAIGAAVPAFANDGSHGRGNDSDRDRAENRSVANNQTWPSSFSLTIQGNVTAKSADSITIAINDQSGVWRHKGWFKHTAQTFKEKFGTSIVVKVNADTKYSSQDKNATITLANIAVGNTVRIKGNYANSVFTGSSVKVVYPSGKAMGTVTAKTADSVTIKNTVTGDTKTVTVDADSKVMINGEDKAIADIQVGDKGVVKFKNKVGTLVAKVINLFR